MSPWGAEPQLDAWTHGFWMAYRGWLGALCSSLTAEFPTELESCNQFELNWSLSNIYYFIYTLNSTSSRGSIARSAIQDFHVMYSLFWVHVKSYHFNPYQLQDIAGYWEGIPGIPSNCQLSRPHSRSKVATACDTAAKLRVTNTWLPWTLTASAVIFGWLLAASGEASRSMWGTWDFDTRNQWQWRPFHPPLQLQLVPGYQQPAFSKHTWDK